MRLFTLILCLFGAQIADAQIGLPPVRVPLPGAGLPSLPTTALPLESNLDAEFRGTDLRGLRALQIRTLLRAHRDVIEADPHGNPIVRGEVLVVAPSATALQAAAAAGFSVARESTLDALELRVVVLRVSSGTARSLARLQAVDPTGIYDFNHIYIESGVASPPSTAGPQAPPVEEKASVASGAGATHIGLIDSGVDPAHEVFSGLALHQHGCSGRFVSHEHGTAVASLMVGRAPTFHGAAPGSELYAADVYCGAPTGGAADMVAEAFSWLVQEKVPVINVSLVGPPNRVLQGVVQRVIAGGHIVVAAVGNDGPAAPPLYPAAWPGVVGVTGVDAHRRVLVEAERGAQVKFAAPGAQMAAAKLPSGYTLVRGTSFAAPIVAGLLALNLPAPDKAAADRAVATLAQEAVDLGSPGLDPVYGFGLVGEALRRQPVLTTLRAD
ncbi:MAG TPA: S8 family serine peptidase [Steroidobacteraceae bacterium]|jgi:subtilisin family serine protease